MLNGNQFFHKLSRQFIFYALLLGAWQFLFQAQFFAGGLFPSPSQVFGALVAGFADATFLQAVFATLNRIFFGYLLSIVLGIVLGLVIGRFKLLEETVGGFILGLQSLPSICWLPLAVLWFGISETAIIFVVVLGSVLAISIGTLSGMKNIQKIYLQVGRNMGAHGLKMFSQVILPAALPSILIGLKQGWIFAWRSLMAGEMLYMTKGLGHLLNTGREVSDMGQVIAVMIVIVVIGIFVDSLVFGTLERKVNRLWGFQT